MPTTAGESPADSDAAGSLNLPYHREGSVPISASAEDVFAYLDDHAALSAHMGESSMMMAGGRMDMALDAGGGRAIGSHIVLRGKFLGLPIFLDEVVTRREPPMHKAWQTVGSPRLIVIGDYRMGFDLARQPAGSVLRVYIDFSLPRAGRLLGRLFGGLYAGWCVEQMLKAAQRYFAARGSTKLS